MYKTSTHFFSSVGSRKLWASSSATSFDSEMHVATLNRLARVCGYIGLSVYM